MGLHSVFLQVKQSFNIKRVLYPGSYLDVTPSLYFPHVSYVDSLSGISKMLADTDLREYIDRSKLYPEPADIRCYEQDYHTFDTAPKESFDSLISLNAGLISQSCGRFLAPGGLLVANDEHYDARRAFVDPSYSLAGVFVGDDCRLETAPAILASCFKTSKGVTLTAEMVDADLDRPPSRARFKTVEAAAAYLFKKRG